MESIVTVAARFVAALNINWFSVLMLLIAHSWHPISMCKLSVIPILLQFSKGFLEIPPRTPCSHTCQQLQCQACETQSYILHDAMHAFFKLPRPVHRQIASPFPLIPKL